MVLFIGDVLKTVLSIYMRGSNLPLPSSAEVCICTSTTTAEEVTDFEIYIKSRYTAIHLVNE